MDVGSWLRSLGLGQHEANFRDNKIDADLLPRLTDAGLKDIGVSALGDRLRLLDAIAALAGPKPPADVTAFRSEPRPPKGPEVSAERRPITVMFCDLVGSTSLAAKLDAEDWRNLVNAYLDEASKAVTGFGGHVLKKLGDGRMVLFGYPQAQENDAERAVRAALAIQRSLADLNNRNAAKGAPELSARIGIESGPVVVEASGEVFGDAPNIAARVQAEAEPGSVLITLNVQRQVAGLFVAEEQSARELKGVSRPVQLFRIVRASGGGRRGGASQLHVAHGNALTAARGFGAPETTAAFARARESASGVKDAPERLAAHWGLWSSSYVRGELPSMRAHAATLLSGVEARPDSPEAGVAHRAAGLRCWFTGEYREARDHFERALALFQPGRDDDLAFRFGHDAGVGAMLYLAIASWSLGDVERAISLMDRMQRRIADLTHVGTRAFGRLHEAFFELMRGEHARAAPNAFELARLGREHDLPMWRAFGVFLEGLATAATGAPGGGLDDMRRGVELLREQNVLLFDGLLKIALAEAEAGAGDPERAIAILDEALATCDRTGYRAFEAELHRTRGEILLKRDPAPAECAFLTAIAVAQQQATRSFGLRAALSLAKLYQSTSRLAEAHDVLAPALEGFSPTPEMPEIAEAQALLVALEAGAHVRHE